MQQLLLPHTNHRKGKTEDSLTTDMGNGPRKEQVETMIIEAVRRITEPVVTVFIKMRRIIRMVQIVAGALVILTALKEAMAGRTINTENLLLPDRSWRKRR